MSSDIPKPLPDWNAFARPHIDNIPLGAVVQAVLAENRDTDLPLTTPQQVHVTCAEGCHTYHITIAVDGVTTQTRH